MKILIIHCHYQLHGGEDAVVEQEVELLKQHHLVETLYFRNIGGWKGAFKFLSSIWNIKATALIKNKILNFQPDVVHIHNWHFAIGPLFFRVINQLGIPIVHTVHNYRLLCPSGILLHNGQLFTDSLKRSFPWKAVQKKVYRSSAVQTFWLAFIVWFHKKIGTFKKIDSFVCLTPFSVNLFHESNFGVSKKQFFVKPNFSYKPETTEHIEMEDHFLFVGRLSEEKGIETLLTAFEDSRFSLKIAGDGPLKEKVVTATKKFSNINYLGNISNSRVGEELRAAQALIFPSICYETFGLVNIEAFANKTPVLASKIGAAESLIIHNYNGFHFEPGNVSELKTAVTRFNTLSEIEKEKMRNNAFEDYKSHYSPARQFGYFEAIYDNVIKKK